MADLREAFLRAGWAAERLIQLAALAQRFIGEEAASITVGLDPDSSAPALSIQGVNHPIDPAIPLLASEVVFHLRASLDYLVFQLALLDSGLVQERTQFPMAETRAGFVQGIPRYLVGITPEHIAMLEEYQPALGVEWVRTLRNLSNGDKHRAFPLTLRRFQGTLTPRTALTSNGREQPQMEYEIRISISLADGSPLIETLDTLQGRVFETLERFRPLFDEPDQR